MTSKSGTEDNMGGEDEKEEVITREKSLDTLTD